jgi:hypothetical protein
VERSAAPVLAVVHGAGHDLYLVGSLILASLLAVLGYFSAQLAWRLHLWAYLRRRQRRRQS